MSSPKLERAILHVDMDAFYASIEQRDDPSIRGKPVIVGGTTGRGVVAAASYEVRKFGVHSAMPMSVALRLCPHAICVSPRMQVYKSVSSQIFAIFHEFTPAVEGLSLDEAFLDVTASQALLGDAVSIAREIKRRIAATTFVTASVGVAPNKLVAKIASDLNKPNGLTVVTPATVNSVLDPLPVRRLPGLGRKTGDKVEARGLHTFAELRAAPESVLWPLFGKYSRRIRERAAGIDDRPVVSDADEKSISAEDTFSTDIADPSKLQSEISRLADRTCTRLRAKGLVAGCVTVKIRRQDFSTYTRQHRIAPETNDTRTITTIARDLLMAWLERNPQARIRLLGVGVSHLAEADQMDLFAAPPAATSLRSAAPPSGSSPRSAAPDSASSARSHAPDSASSPRSRAPETANPAGVNAATRGASPGPARGFRRDAATPVAPHTTSSKLDTALDAIRQKFGTHALTSAGHLDDKSD